MSGTKRSGPSGRKGHLPTGDLIALGSKSGITRSSLRHSEDSKQPSSLKQGSSGAAPPPTKKSRPALSSEGTGGLFSDPIKVSQVTQLQSQTAAAKFGPAGGSKPQQTSSSSSSSPQVIEVRPSELVSAVREARSSGNETKVTKILSGALKQFRLSRLKPDSVLNSSLTTLAKDDSQLFSTPAAVEGLVAVLKREPSVIFKARSNPSVYILASQLLLLGLRDSYDWPEAIAKVYIEDSLGDRVWVDLEPCKKLVENICTIFQTRTYSLPGSGSGSTSGPGQLQKTSDTGSAGQTGQTGLSEGDSGDGGGEEGEGNRELQLESVEVEPRFSMAICKSLKSYILQLVNEQLGRHGMPTDSASRNLLKFLTTAAGLPEIRLLVTQRVEGWIQNPKLGKQCQDLLMTLAVNCHTHGPEDIKVIEALVNVRLKTKLFSNQFVACIKELISSHTDNLATVLHGVVYNELGQLRSPSNMALLSMMVHTWPDEAAKLLGAVFQEFLTRKEDYLRALRGFLRELVRQVRNEFSFTTFSRSLMQERQEAEFTQLEQSQKERLALSLADLITCSCMLTANMLIREAYNGFTKGEKAMVAQLQEFFNTLGVIQRDAVWWIHTIVPHMLRPQPTDYKTCLRKVLFLEPAESYHSKDNWPPESDRNLILRLMMEACLKEDTLMRVLVIGLTRELPLSPADALDIADKLVARAANAHSEDIPRLPTVERRELFNVIFDITAYRPPPNIQLPEDYEQPTLAISKLYWKGWILLLVLAAFNSKSIGAMGWSDYPTLRGMMEMVMTNTYTFPTSMSLPTNEDGSLGNKDSAIMRELQISRSEKEAILEYESYLAASSSQTATITESNSYLLNQVTLLQPKGPARKLPSSVVELIKSANRSLKLGQLLCKCRSPDFLLDVIKRQGTLESMKWLTELVESSHSSLEVLPVPCLCEFLMASYQDQGGAPVETETDLSSHRAQYKRKKSAKEKTQERHWQLVGQLQSLLSGPQSSPQSCTEVLEYFFDKLTLSHLTPRKLALKGLQEILKKSSGMKRADRFGTEGEDYTTEEWLVTNLPALPHFATVLPRICHLLLQACLVETNLCCLQSYILFLTQHTPTELLFKLSIGISQIIVDRFEILRKLFLKSTGPTQKSKLNTTANITLRSLIKMLRDALDMALHSQTTPQASEGSDFLLISFPNGQTTILHTALIQATFLLLACNPSTFASDFKYLLDMWFPPDVARQPEAFTVDTKEKAVLIPDLILQYMLRSTNPRVLDTVVKNSEPSQLFAFIQKFGVPQKSMERVLDKLDSMCESTQTAVQLRNAIAIEDATQLGDCIEVQLLRGVSTGKSFLSYLQGLASLPTEPIEDIHSLLQEQDTTKESLPAPTKSTQPGIPNIPQERMEQLLLQIFAPSLSRISVSPQESQKLAADLKSGIMGLITSSTEASLSSGSLNTPISGLIAALHKMATSGSTRRQFVKELVKNAFSISFLRLITKIQLINANEDLSAGLFKATLQHILGVLDSMKVLNLKAQGLFQAALKSCAEQLGVKQPAESAQLPQKLESVAKKTCKDISKCRDPFENEATLLRNCRYIVESKSPLVEDIICVIARRAIGLGKEAKCIEFLHKIQPFSISHIPVPIQCAPEIFKCEDINDEQQLSLEKMEVSSELADEESVTEFSIASNLDLNGLTVDWLEVLDPEILSLCPMPTQQLVFGSSPDLGIGTGSPAMLVSGQGYLLARLTHESSWPTRTDAIASILDPAKLKEWVNPSAVLDFLWACLHNPGLWQGRVRKEAVINSLLSLGIDADSKLKLTRSQMVCLLDCILGEAAYCVCTEELKNAPGAGNPTSKPDYDVPPEANNLLYSRLPLLMSCWHDDQESITTVVKHLQTHNSYPSLSWQLLVHLYHANERVILAVDNTHLLSVSALATSTPCKLDTELHSLLSAMTDAQPGQESMQKMTNAALLCRKIAVRHPALMIRQLPMLGWLLRGRAHLNPSEFRNRNHRHVFINAFVLLELLQPLVFEDTQNKALETCLEPFFEFLKNQCLESKKYQSLVTKFANFLIHYIHHNGQRAAAVIDRHLDTLQALSEANTSKKSSLKALVECFPKPKVVLGDQAALSVTRNGSRMILVPPATVGHSLTHEQLMPFLKKLEYGQLREDILKVLQDLEETSLHSVEILKHFVPELCRIIMDPEPTSCKLAHNLLLRHLKQSPGGVDDLVPVFLSCLESHDRTVVMAAVASIPDLVLLCKAQDASFLLGRLFQMATQSAQFSSNCVPELRKAVEACTQHTFR